MRRGPTYDTARAPRSFQFVPLWGFVVLLWLLHQAYRCPRCGVTVELSPGRTASIAPANAFRLFMARWARRLSWSEVAEIFGNQLGRGSFALSGGWSTGASPTAILDGCQRPSASMRSPCGRATSTSRSSTRSTKGFAACLWVGRERTEEGFRGFFQTFGKVRAEKLQFVASDMWKPYIKLIAEFAGAGHPRA